MPELPEVETVRRTLIPAIGAQIQAVWDSGKGLHMRRKLEDQSGQYWHVDLMRETRHWGSTSDFFASDQVFTGTALKFGIGW